MPPLVMSVMNLVWWEEKCHKNIVANPTFQANRYVLYSERQTRLNFAFSICYCNQSKQSTTYNK